jgi:hypothetical protein
MLASGGRSNPHARRRRAGEANIHLNIVGREHTAGVANGEEVGGCDKAAEGEGDGGEEAEGVLDTVEGVVHAGRR